MVKNEEELEYVCTVKLYYDTNKETFILDLRDTDCLPDKALNVLKRFNKHPHINIKLPGLIEK